jgi:acetaldehyde dehydrogenase/alcohol dehydrogenase
MLGQTDKIIKACEGHGMVCTVYDKVVPDPTIKCIMEGVTEMNVFKPDLAIALGGGSAMDAAKMMRLFYEYPDQDLQDIATRFVDIRKRVVGCPKLGRLIKTLVCIPTTSGTGAEVTPFAVVTSEEGRKYPLVDYELTPDMAIVDPEFAVGMPKRLTSWTGIDALTHAIESYVSIMATDFTRPYSLRAVSLIFESLSLAYNNGKDIEAREKMHNASAIAGMAFANALMLSHIIMYNATDSPVKMGTFQQYKYPQAMRHYAEIAELLLPPTQVVKMTDVDKVQYLIDRVEQLKADVGIPKSIKECGMVTEEEFFNKVDQVAIMAFDDQCTGANPRYPLVSELKQLMIDAWNGVEPKL